MLTYHGSASLFDTFDYSKIGAHATSEGYGFYTTNNKQVAKSYAEKYLYTYNFVGKKPLATDKKIIMRKQWAKLLDVLHDKCDILNDFNDVEYVGRSAVLREAVEMLVENSTNDNDILCEICNISGNKELVIKELYKLFKYDCIKLKADWGKQKLYIALVSDALELVKVEEVA